MSGGGNLDSRRRSSSDEVVAVDHLVGDVRRAGRSCACRRSRGASPRRSAPCPGRRASFDGSRTSTTSPSSKLPMTPVTPAGSSDVPRSTKARVGAVVDADDAVDLTGEADPQLARRQPRDARLERRADQRRRRPRRPARSARSAAAITARVARPRRHLRGGTASRPCRRCPVPDPVAPAATVKQRIVGEHLVDQLGRRVGARVGGEQPGRVGEQHQQIGVDVVGDERGDAIVVAVAQLVAGDRVVLVDDRDAAELDQPQQRLAGVQVLAAIDEVVRHEQHLRGDETDGGRATGCTCSISRLCPAAEIACSVGMSVGRADSPARRRRPTPRPTTTRITSWPPARSAAS